MSKPNVQALVRTHLADLPPYVPIEPFEVLSARLSRAPQSIIKLDANENPYGLSPSIRTALADLEFPHIYPDPESRALRSALSKFTGVPEKYLVAGAGADELIDLIIRVLVEPGDCVISCPPTFGMYPFDTHLNAGTLVEVPRNTGFSLDITAIKQAVHNHKPKILFLASPNNPDGSVITQHEFDQLLELPVIIVLDEAYIEFNQLGRLGNTATRITAVPGLENLIVLRTFSKWAGLAGLRVGYGAFPDWLMPTLWKAKQPYNVNVAASTAAIAALEDLDNLADKVALICAERDLFFNRLADISWLHAYPSCANFILCQVLERDAAVLKDWLATRHGILVRYFNTPQLKDHIRISIGRPEDMQMLHTALCEVNL